MSAFSFAIDSSDAIAVSRRGGALSAGSSSSSGASSPLVWKDGVLVKALRAGDWIILDELNLAPSEVLEALKAYRAIAGA